MKPKEEVREENWQKHFYMHAEENADVYKDTIHVGGQMFSNIKKFDYRKWINEQNKNHQLHMKMVRISFEKWHKEFNKA